MIVAKSYDELIPLLMERIARGHRIIGVGCGEYVDDVAQTFWGMAMYPLAPSLQLNLFTADQLCSRRRPAPAVSPSPTENSK